MPKTIEFNGVTYTENTLKDEERADVAATITRIKRLPVMRDSAHKVFYAGRASWLIRVNYTHRGVKREILIVDQTKDMTRALELKSAIEEALDA